MLFAYAVTLESSERHKNVIAIMAAILLLPGLKDLLAAEKGIL